MRHDSRLSGVLHLLLHMAQADGPVTSTVLARAMDTNPVVIRRIMSGLRERGYVHAAKGHGGGWTLACDLSTVSLRDIYDALGCPTLFALGNRTDTPGCLVEAAVNTALGRSFQEAEAVLLARLGAVTLDQVQADVKLRLQSRAADCPPLATDSAPTDSDPTDSTPTDSTPTD